MDLEKRLGLIKQVGEEILTEEELKNLLETKAHPIAYDGFEPSGKLHIAQGIMRAINVNKMLSAGVHFKMWVADWFGWMNNKMGGDLEKIQTIGKYQIEVWKACGMKTKEIEFLWTSEVIAKNPEYWKRTLNIARTNSVARIIRCAQIMGRSETENLSAAQIFYPCMQASDIFELKADITQLGMDQRKVNILARETGPKLGLWKPVVVSHHMLMGLKQVSHEDRIEYGKMSAIDRAIGMKMSKSIPDSAIFMDDSAEEIKRKISKAFCPEKIIEENPILEYCRYLIFEKFKTLKIERQQKFGGNLELENFDELAKIYSEGKLHPMDLKNSVALHIDKMVAPAREHFASGKAKKLLEQVRGFEVTR